MSPSEADPNAPPVASGAAAAVLDAQALARLAELDPDGSGELVQRVLRTYVASMERLMLDFRNARASAQATALRHVAHTLKSSSASVGALQLAALCAQLEQHVREGGQVPDSNTLDTLEAESARVASAVRAMLGH